MAVLPCLHLISFGILLGSQFFQTCFNGITAFRALHRHYFGVHQAAIFPVYFSLQSFFPLLVILTSARGRIPVLQLSGVLLPASHESVSPMGLASLCGLINLVIFGPLTRNVVRAKKVQEIRDGKKSYDAAALSPEMMALNNQFLVIHVTSIAINMAGFFATIHYGIALSKRLS